MNNSYFLILALVTSFFSFQDEKIADEITFNCKGDFISIKLPDYEEIKHENYEEGYFKIIKIDGSINLIFFCGSLMDRPFLKGEDYIEESMCKKRVKTIWEGTMSSDSTLIWREDQYQNFSIYYLNISKDRKLIFDDILDSILISDNK